MHQILFKFYMQYILIINCCDWLDTSHRSSGELKLDYCWQNLVLIISYFWLRNFTFKLLPPLEARIIRVMGELKLYQWKFPKNKRIVVGIYWIVWINATSRNLNRAKMTELPFYQWKKTDDKLVLSWEFHWITWITNPTTCK